MNPGKRHIFTFLIFVVLMLSLGQFISCQKKLFKNIEVHGRLVNFITGEPVTGKVELFTDNVHYKAPGDPEKYLLASGEAKSDGTFTLKSSASKRDNYYLFVDHHEFQPKESPTPPNAKIQVKNGKKNDLGDILAGNFTFTVKIKLVPKTFYSLWLFPCKGDKDYIYYDPQTSTTVIQQCEQRFFDYASFHAYTLRWRADVYNSSNYNILANNSASLPLWSSDTLTYTLNY